MPSARLAAFIFCLVAGWACSRAESVLQWERTLHEERLADDALGTDAVFTCRNSGTKPVRLQQAIVSCGCTRPTLPEAPVPPGGSAQVRVRFDAGHYRGRIERQVTIVSAEPGEERVDLRLVITIPEWLRLERQVLLWTAQERGEEKSLTLTLDPQAPWKITGAVCSTESFDLALVTTEGIPGQWSLRVRPKPGAPAGHAEVRLQRQPDTGRPPPLLHLILY